jgi:hypothetical protein
LLAQPAAFTCAVNFLEWVVSLIGSTIITGMRRAAVFSAVLFLGLAFTLISRDSDPRLRRATRAGERNGWIQVHLEGKPAEIGYQHGYLLATEIQENFRVISTELVHEEKHDWAFFRKAAEQTFWPHVEQEYREEITGIVEGLKARGVKLGNPNGARALRGKQVGNREAVAERGEEREVLRLSDEAAPHDTDADSHASTPAATFVNARAISSRSRISFSGETST